MGTVTVFVPAQCCVFIPWWWRWQLPAIHQYVSTKVHSVTSQNQIIHKICSCIVLCKLRKSNVQSFGGETKQTIWKTSVLMDPEWVQWEGLALGGQVLGSCERSDELLSSIKFVAGLELLTAWGLSCCGREGNGAVVCCVNLMFCDDVSFTLLWQIS